MNQHKKGHRILGAIVALAVVVTSMAGLLAHIKLNNIDAADRTWPWFASIAATNHWGRSDLRAYMNNKSHIISSDDSEHYYINSTVRHGLFDPSDNTSGYASHFSDDEYSLIQRTTVNTYERFAAGSIYENVYETTDKLYLPSGNSFTKVLSWGKDDIAIDDTYIQKVVNKGDINRLIPINYWPSSSKGNWLRSINPTYNATSRPTIYSSLVAAPGDQVKSAEVTEDGYDIASVFKIDISGDKSTPDGDGKVIFASNTYAYSDGQATYSTKESDGLYLRVLDSNLNFNTDVATLYVDNPNINDGKPTLDVFGASKWPTDVNCAVVQAYDNAGTVLSAATFTMSSGSRAYHAYFDIASWFTEDGGPLKSSADLQNYTIKVWIEQLPSVENGDLIDSRIKASEPFTLKVPKELKDGEAPGEDYTLDIVTEESENINKKVFATVDELQYSWGDLSKLTNDEYSQLLEGNLDFDSTRNDESDADKTIKEIIGATDQKIHFGTYTDGGVKKRMSFWVAGREDENGAIDPNGNILVLYQAESCPDDQMAFNTHFLNEEDNSNLYISSVEKLYRPERFQIDPMGTSFDEDNVSWSEVTYRPGMDDYIKEHLKISYRDQYGGYHLVTYGELIDGDIGLKPNPEGEGTYVDEGKLYYCATNENWNIIDTEWKEWPTQTPGIGYYKIMVILYENGNHEQAYSGSANLRIKEGDQKFAITLDGKKSSGTVEITYGEERTIGLTTEGITDGYVNMGGTITWSTGSNTSDSIFIDGGTNKIKAVNVTNGEQLSVTVEGNAFYNTTESSLTIKVNPKPIGDGSATPADGINIEINGFADGNNDDGVIYEYNRTKDTYPSVTSVTDKNFTPGTDTQLKEGSDYYINNTLETTWKNITAEGSKKQQEGTLTITGQNNYTGSIIKKYYVQDNTEPKAKIELVGKNNYWEDLLNKLTFGLFFKDKKTIQITVDEEEDFNSGVASIKYYIDYIGDGAGLELDKNKEYTSEEIRGMLSSQIKEEDWQTYNNESKPEVGDTLGKYVVYARIEDNAGNITYISTNGFVIYDDVSMSDAEMTKTRTYEKNTKVSEGAIINLALKGNTVANITYKLKGADESTRRSLTTDDYEVGDIVEDQITPITLKSSFLNNSENLVLDQPYEFTITYNPFGEAYVETDGEDPPRSTTVELTVLKRTLKATDVTFEQPRSEVYEKGNPDIIPKLTVTNNVLHAEIQPDYELYYYKYMEDSDSYSESPLTEPDGVGKYKVTAIIKEDDYYYKEGILEDEDNEWIITLKYADKNGIPPEPGEITAIYGQTLKDVKLRDGWAFVENEGQNLDTPVGNVQSNGYSYFTAKYTPTDPAYGSVIADIGIKVNPKDLSNEANITLNQSVYTYNGSRWQPQVEVKYGDLVLQSYDYTVTYPSDMTLIGEKQITINFRGNYTGSKTVTGLIDVDRSTWGEEQVINNIKHYVTSDGTTSVEVNEGSKDENGIIWLQESSGGTSAWYGIQYPSGTFMDKSRFYVNWLDQTANRTAWQTAYAQLDDEHKNKVSSGRMRIVQIGVNDPYGNAYTNLDTQISLYVQIGSDWSKDDLNAVYLEQSTDEVINLSFEENKSFVGGRGDFANLTISRFAPYCVYDGAKFNTIDIINNPNTTIGALESGFYVAPDNSDGNDGTLDGLRTVDRIRERQDAQNGNDNVETFIANDNINIKQQSKSSSIAMWIVIIIAILGALLLVIMRMQRKYGVKYYYDMMLYRIKETWETIKNKFKPKSKTQN